MLLPLVFVFGKRWSSTEALASSKLSFSGTKSLLFASSINWFGRLIVSGAGVVNDVGLEIVVITKYFAKVFKCLTIGHNTLLNYLRFRKLFNSRSC
jgi:hypothetical protein